MIYKNVKDGEQVPRKQLEHADTHGRPGFVRLCVRLSVEPPPPGNLWTGRYE